MPSGEARNPWSLCVELRLHPHREESRLRLRRQLEMADRRHVAIPDQKREDRCDAFADKVRGATVTAFSPLAAACCVR